MKSPEKNIKKSSSLIRFRNDLDEIFNNVIALERYELLYFLTKKSTSNDIGLNKNQESFECLDKFEKENNLNNSFFVQVISVMEVYLQDRIVEEIDNNPSKLNHLVKNYKWNRKFTPDDVINGPIALANELMNSVVFHKLDLVNVLYKIVLKIEILPLLKDKRVWDSIKIRHKITHRAGKIGEEKIYVTTDGLLNTINSVSKWIENIDYFYRTKKTKNSTPNYLNKYTKLRLELEKHFEPEMLEIGYIHMSRSDFFKNEDKSKLIIVR